MKRLCSVLITALFLAGCGGGTKIYTPIPDTGVPETPPNVISTPGEAQGIYAGTFDWAGVNFCATILPDDMFYEIYGRTDQNGAFQEIWGIMKGQGVSRNGKYTATVTNFVIDDSFVVTLDTHTSGRLRLMALTVSPPAERSMA